VSAEPVPPVLRERLVSMVKPVQPDRREPQLPDQQDRLDHPELPVLLAKLVLLDRLGHPELKVVWVPPDRPGLVEQEL